jgi:hypothetical protein
MGGKRKVAGTAADRPQQCEERQQKGRWKKTDPIVNNSTENPHHIIILAHDPISKAQFQLVKLLVKEDLKSQSPN